MHSEETKVLINILKPWVTHKKVFTQREISSGCGDRKNVVTYNVVMITTFNS